jgi:serine/threonine protein kinase/tetratricopeptide (TPR) repeat protein
MSADADAAKAIFLEAVERHAPDQWPAFLDQACAGQPELRGRVEALLAAHREVGTARHNALPEGADAGPAATVDQPPLREQPGTVIGPYKLLEPIGEGGFGLVFLAEQTEPVRRKVALKVLKLGMDTHQVVARFEAERQALALMDHPNIARVFDGGATPSGRPYFVMELVKGVPITEFCDQNQLTPRERLELFVPVCQAVQHAHQKGIIHRDLKPSNVLVSRYDATPVVKVIDFGVAKALGQELTDKTLFTGLAQMIGTPLYMSPEQAGMSDLDIDTRSDVYALGVLLYELLTGTTPFTRERFQRAAYDEIRRIIREEEPPKPSTRLSESKDSLPSISAQRDTEPARLTKLVRGELDWIVMKALEKDRARRYETASAFAMDVRRYLADEPVLAGPPSARYRLRKFARRHRGPVLAVLLLLLTLIAGIIGTTWGMLEARRRAEGERQAKLRAEANFALASEAVETYLGTVTNDRKLKQADFHELRKKLLESAIPFFQRLTEQQSDDPEVEAGRGRAYFRLANVHLVLGENEAAKKDAEAMQAIFARLTTDFPSVPVYRHELANSHSKLAESLVRVGNLVEAEAAYRRALDIYEKLVADFPKELVYRNNLATGHDALGGLLYRLGKHEKAEPAFRKALDIREKLTREFPEDPECLQAPAASLNNLGILLSRLGRFPEAEAIHRQALDVCEQLVADFPEEPEYRRRLPGNYTNLGHALADQGKHEEARAAFLQALDIYEKLAADFPSVPEHRDDLATCLNNLGYLLVRSQKLPEAEAAFRRALGILEKLAADFPTVPEYRNHLAISHNSLGNVLEDQGKHEEARAAFRQALDIYEKLVADFPDVLEHLMGLGGAYCNFGILTRDSGQPDAALGWFQKAIARLEPVLASQPRLFQAREFLRNSHFGRAQALGALGRHAEATRDWERALELEDGPLEEWLRANVADSRLRESQEDKDAAGCLAAAAEYEALKPSEPGELYDAACCRAVCAAVILEDPRTPEAEASRLAREQADLAMAWLHKAVAAGFTNVEHMKQDTDLEALRERDDFKSLLAELQARQK